MTLLRIVVEGTSAYADTLRRLEERGETDFARVEHAVRDIIAAVRREGDAAVRRLCAEYEGREVSELLRRDYGGAAALGRIAAETRNAMMEAATRIRTYHEHQLERLGSFEYRDGGVLLGSRVTPLGRVGVYVPGGKASYPSSVLMSATIAAVAGVSEVIVSTPNPSDEVRAACHLAGVHALLDVGGAQAIAAMAYGTETVPRVDKIVGPGNVYVAAAKRLVFGQVDIDGIAGPSEILVVADETADAMLVAADLLSQAEHDEAAYPMLLCQSEAFALSVDREVERQLQTLPRREMAEASLSGQGYALVVSSREQLGQVADRLAAEHVALHVRDAAELCLHVRRAGAIFLGDKTPEAAGDYVAGPSHVLPTGGAARYGAPLGVYDFVSRSSIIGYELSALGTQAPHITALARAEGLEAHARAVEVRFGRGQGSGVRGQGRR